MAESPSRIDQLIRKHALYNASKHEGRADAGAVVSKVIAEEPEAKRDVKALIPRVKLIVDEVNRLSRDAQLSILGAEFPDFLKQMEGPREKKRLPPLPNAEQGRLVVRLPPEPSGYMHIGHAMAGIINSLYAAMYGGKLWLRFEDTNPRKVQPEYYESFREGYSWLGIKWDYEKSVSEDLPLIYEHGERMVRSGSLYVCGCPPEAIKKNRFEGVACECRNKTAEENLDAWRRVLKGSYAEAEAVARFRGDMRSQDYSLRDPNLFRIIEHPHPVTGDRYRVWPVYDLAVVVEDHVCGVTHILRSMEFHAALQEQLRRALGLQQVTVVQFSRFNFEGTPLSKRKLRPLIEQKLVPRWDDPRMPTLSGMRRRGVLPETLTAFTKEVGYTRVEHVFAWDLIFAVNRKILDPISKRYFFVPDPVKTVVKDAPAVKRRIPFHPDRDLGYREVEAGDTLYISRGDLQHFQRGDVFRLMDMYNVRLADRDGSEARCAYAGSELVREMPKIQWVTEDHLPFKVIVPDRLFIGEEFNTRSLRAVEGYAEAACRDLRPGEIVQFPRFGFCRVDAPGVAILAHK